MPNALQTMPPPAPNTDQPSLSQGMAQGNPLQQLGGPSPGPNAGPQQQQAPAPTHAQTVAALRHFDAIGKQLESALKDPDLGKSSIKQKVIDGMTTLVASRIVPPSDAVGQLAEFPEKPFEQKQWLLQHLQHLMQARNAVLVHHGIAYAGGGPEPTPHPDDHMADISGMMSSHYGGGRG
jgi:hypothetical protein